MRRAIHVHEFFHTFKLRFFTSFSPTVTECIKYYMNFWTSTTIFHYIYILVPSMGWKVCRDFVFFMFSCFRKFVRPLSSILLCTYNVPRYQWITIYIVSSRLGICQVLLRVGRSNFFFFSVHLVHQPTKPREAATLLPYRWLYCGRHTSKLQCVDS